MKKSNKRLAKRRLNHKVNKYIKVIDRCDSYKNSGVVSLIDGHID